MIRLPTRHAVLLGILFAAAGAARADEYADRMAAGKAAIDDIRYREAAAAFEKAVALSLGFGEDDPRYLAALFHFADALTGIDENARAEGILRQGLAAAEKRHGKESPLVAHALRVLADAVANQDRAAEADPLYARALEIRRKALGPGHPDTAESLNIAGNQAANQQRYRDAESLLREALSAYEKAQDQPKAATVRNNLGYVYAAQENFRQAEAEYRKSLEIRRKVLRADHPDIGAVSSNLADTCVMQGKDAEAEALLKEAVRIAEKDDPQGTNLGYALHNLACLYSQTGRTGDSLPLFERSRAVWEKAEGPESDIVAVSLDMHAGALELAGRGGEARDLRARAERIRNKPPADPAAAWLREQEAGARALSEGRFGDAVSSAWKAVERARAFGETDERHIRSLLQLATALRNQPDYPQAESTARQALTLAEKSLGREAAELAGILNILALICDDRDRAAEAEPLYQRALAIRAKGLGPDHPDTAQSVYNLASILQKQRKHEEAEKLFQRALKIYEKGGYEADAALVTNALGLLHDLQGRADEAEADLRRAMERYEKSVGPEAPGLIDVCFNLGDLHRRRNQLDETERLLQRAIAIAGKLGPDHTQLAKALHNLAVLHMGRGGRNEEADGLYRRSRAIWEKALGPYHPQVAQSLDNHARLLDAMKGREAEAAEMRRRVEEIRARRR